MTYSNHNYIKNNSYKYLFPHDCILREYYPNICPIIECTIWRVKNDFLIYK